MSRRYGFIVSVFLVFIIAASGTIFGQRVIDLDKVWCDMRVLGDDAGDYSGRAVAYGEINGDGFMDIIIGAPYADPGGRTDAGEVYVIFGSSSPPSTIDLSTTLADITICGASADDRSGFAVASGDVNGDGYDDIVIGAYEADPGDPPRDAAGETYVIYGSSNPPSTIDLNTTPADLTVCGAFSGSWSGLSVASGNLNGDGYDDIIVGSPYADPGGREKAGETYVIFGKSFASPTTIDLSTTPADITVCGDDSEDYSGCAVASGDVNGDGFDDIIIGALLADPGDPPRDMAGETYVNFGSSNPASTVDLSTTSADITICGAANYYYSASAVASGDVNNDGFDDIIIGASGADPGGRIDAGETYVVFGSSSPP